LANKFSIRVAFLVEVLIEVAAGAAAGLGRDYGRLAGCGQRRDDPFVGVERLVGDQRVSVHGGQQVIGSDQIMGLPAGQEKAQGVAQSIGQGMDFGAQSAARTPDRLVLTGFFWAPALC